MADTCIYVVNHQDSQPLREAPYRLLRVNSSSDMDDFNPDVSYDSQGESIAYKNFAYCELTGLYWIWKNTSHHVVGLMHYRRFLAAPGTDRPLSERDIEAALRHYDCLVPRPAPLSCSLAEHYCFCHVSTDLVALREVMDSQPEKYRLAFSEAMNSSMIIPCNIMIAKRVLFDEYCEWLFSVLEECEKRIDLFKGRDAYQMRVFGFLAERLLLVWLIANDVNCGFYDVITVEEATNLHEDPVGEYHLDLMSGINGIDRSQLFDSAFYLDTYKDVAAAYPEDKAIDHYLEYGIPEGRYPSPAYSLDEYANLRPKIRSKVGEMSPKILTALKKESAFTRPVLPRHKVLGITRHRLMDYAPVYDWAFYTSKYDDVPNDYFHTEDALQHFIDVGIPQGRQGSKGFSLDTYKIRHPELVEKYGDDNIRYFMDYLRRDGKNHYPINWKYVG